LSHVDDVIRPIWKEASEALDREFVFPEMKEEEK